MTNLRWFKTTIIRTFAFRDVRFPKTVASIVAFTKTMLGFYYEFSSIAFAAWICCFQRHFVCFVDLLWKPGDDTDRGDLHTTRELTNEFELHALWFWVGDRHFVLPLLAFENFEGIRWYVEDGRLILCVSNNELLRCIISVLRIPNVIKRKILKFWKFGEDQLNTEHVNFCVSASPFSCCNCL